MSEFSLKGVDFPEGYVALIDKPYEWTSADVVRHALVQEIINAYEKAERKAELPKSAKLTSGHYQRKK